jgi:hypothetical protein
MPALNFGVPSNLMEYYSIIVPIVNFDVLENYDWYQDFLDWLTIEKKIKKVAMKRLLAQSGFQFKTKNPEDPLIPNQTQTIGYGSHSPLHNLGTVTLVFIFYIIKVLTMFFIIKPINYIFGKGKDLYNKWFQ